MVYFFAIKTIKCKCLKIVFLVFLCFSRFKTLIVALVGLSSALEVLGRCRGQFRETTTNRRIMKCVSKAALPQERPGSQPVGEGLPHERVHSGLQVIARS